MKRSEMIVCLNYLFEAYPYSKAESNKMLEAYYERFGHIDPDIFTMVLKTYLKNKGEYFPRPDEIEVCIGRMKEKAFRIVNDVRNEYFVKPDAYERRQRKIRIAKEFLERINGTERKALK